MSVHILKEQASVIPAASGDMGLRGLWAQIFHSTAMSALVVITFLALWATQRMHDEAMATVRDFNAQLVGQIRGALDANTRAVETLSVEIRNLRSH